MVQMVIIIEIIHGKIHGRNNSEYNEATHFRIKKREEM